MMILSHLSRNYYSVLEKSRSERDRVLNTELEGLTAPLNIPPQKTTIMLLLLDRDRVETIVGILTTAVASTLEATPRLLISKLGSNAPLALHRLLWQAQKLGTTLETPLADSYTNRWRLPRCSILYKKIEDSISNPPPIDAEPETTIGATDIRDSSKRIVDSVGLTRAGKVYIGQRRPGVQVSAQVLVAIGASNNSRKTRS